MMVDLRENQRQDFVSIRLKEIGITILMLVDSLHVYTTHTFLKVMIFL